MIIWPLHSAELAERDAVALLIYSETPPRKTETAATTISRCFRRHREFAARIPRSASLWPRGARSRGSVRHRPLRRPLWTMDGKGCRRAAGSERNHRHAQHHSNDLLGISWRGSCSELVKYRGETVHTDEGKKNKKGSHTSPFRQYPISPRSGHNRNVTTTPGKKLKTTTNLNPTSASWVPYNLHFFTSFYVNENKHLILIRSGFIDSIHPNIYIFPHYFAG